MNLKNNMSLFEAKKNLVDIFNKVKKGNDYFYLTENDRVKVVMMSAREFDFWRETIEVRRDFPNLDQDIENAENDYKKGDYITLEDLIAKEGFILADKNKLKNVQSNNSKKDSKRLKKN